MNENRTDWDTTLSSALWAYRTSFKTSVQATPFRLANGLEAVTPVEFQIPSLRIQVKDRMPEEASERIRLQQLLALSEMRVRSLAILELDQQGHARVSDTHGEDARKTLLPLDRAILDNSPGKRDVHIRNPGRGNLATKSKQIPVEAICGDHTP